MNCFSGVAILTNKRTYFLGSGVIVKIIEKNKKELKRRLTGTGEPGILDIVVTAVKQITAGQL